MRRSHLEVTVELAALRQKKGKVNSIKAPESQSHLFIIIIRN